MQQHRFDHITPVLKPLHWLPVEHIIAFKIFLLVHKTLSWWVWSIGADLVVGHIIRYNCAEGSFSHCGPVLWKCGTVYLIYLWSCVLLLLFPWGIVAHWEHIEFVWNEINLTLMRSMLVAVELNLSWRRCPVACGAQKFTLNSHLLWTDLK